MTLIYNKAKFNYRAGVVFKYCATSYKADSSTFFPFNYPEAEPSGYHPEIYFQLFSS